MKHEAMIEAVAFWLFAVIFWFGCGGSLCYQEYESITSYPISTTAVTDDGIRIDDPNNEISRRIIDGMTSDLEECLGVSIRRECFIVKVAPDWYTSECTGSQLFPCEIEDRECIEKGATSEILDVCPCACRARLQGDAIIVTPDLLLYKAELARMVLGENNPWLRHAECL